MARKISKRALRTRWMFIGVYIGFIFCSLPIAPQFFDFLKKYMPVEQIVNLMLLSLGSFTLWLSAKRGVGKRASQLFKWLLPVFILMFSGLMTIKLPIERIHVIEYGILSIASYRTLKYEMLKREAVFGAILIAMTVAVLDELIQMILPNRVFQMEDLLFNTFGVLVGLLFYGYFHWVLKRVKS